ncbi:MAG: PLP-dependent aminotransferase family protein [Phycisphaerales bacterium JB043]
MLYQEIVRVLSEDITNGTLKPGDRLPTHRDLASRLGTARSTIRHAYAEAEQLGLISSQVGRGTFVGREPTNDRSSRQSKENQEISLLLDNPLGQFGPNMHKHVCELLRTDDLSEYVKRQPVSGTLRHREAGARWLSLYGLERGADQVILTAGSQHALFLTLLQNLRPGDTLLTSATTYSGLLRIARTLSINVIGMPMDEGGLLPDAVDAMCRKHKTRALYCTPTIHNPLTMTMDTLRREAIAEIARKNDLLVIEDDALRLFEDVGPPPIASLAPERTVFIGNFTKPVALGVRVAYVSAPEHTLARISEGLFVNLFYTCTLSSALASHLIESGEAQRVLEPKRVELRQRHAMIQELLGPHANKAMSPSLYYWLELNDSWSPTQFVKAASNKGVTLGHARLFHWNEHVPNAVRFCYTSTTGRDELRQSIAIMRGMLEQHHA